MKFHAAKIKLVCYIIDNEDTRVLITRKHSSHKNGVKSGQSEVRTRILA